MDLKALAETIGLDEDEVLELVELFLETCTSDLAKLATAIEGNDHRTVAETAHSIKGAAGNMRFQTIYDMSKEIEMDARNKVLDHAMEKALKIGEELQVISGGVPS